MSWKCPLRQYRRLSIRWLCLSWGRLQLSSSTDVCKVQGNTDNHMKGSRRLSLYPVSFSPCPWISKASKLSRTPCLWFCTVDHIAFVNRCGATPFPPRLTMWCYARCAPQSDWANRANCTVSFLLNAATCKICIAHAVSPRWPSHAPAFRQWRAKTQSATVLKP